MNDFSVPQHVFQLMRDLPCTWAVAGGWAVDLFLNCVTREHQDIEIAILRDDRQMLYEYLASRGWSFNEVVNGRFYPWVSSERLSLPVHEIWGHYEDGDCRHLEVLLNERSERDFVFRRDARIRLPLDSAFVESKIGIPILAPEIVLLYKSKYFDQAKETADLSRVLPVLSEERRRWLFDSIATLDPLHPWLNNSHSYGT